MGLAEAILSPRFSMGIFLTLMGCLIASLTMFVVLVKRWITHKFRFELEQWAGQKRFVMSERPNTEALPPPLDGSEGSGLCARWFFKSKEATVAQLILAASARDIRLFNVCIVQHAANCPPVALKPSHGERFVIDLFRLAPAASTSSERFQIFGNDLSANLRISESSVAGIAPPDIAFLFADGHLLIDFSARPFDPIEFDRMLALAEQIRKIEW
jgi:hypothetical protein